MTWIPSAHCIPVGIPLGYDLRRVWNPDGSNGIQSLAAGPVTGTAAIQAINTGSGPYGPSFWQESSSIGIAAEAAKYRGDWTWEAIVYFNNANQTLLFSSGGWAAQVPEDRNITSCIYFTGTRLTCMWQYGANNVQNMSATSNTNLSSGVWYHLAIVKDSVAKTIAYYVDGVAHGTATYANNPTGGDTTTAGECRTGIGPYVGDIGHPSQSVRIAATTFSTTKRDATWIANSATHKTTDVILPTDSDTWINFGPILLSVQETRALYPADAAYQDGYDDGYDDGYADGDAAGQVTGYAAGYADGYADGVASVPSPNITLSNPLPTPGELAADRAAARYTEISFDVDNPGSIKYSLWVKFANDERGWMVYDSTVGFCPPFTGVWDESAGRLRVWANGGWQDDIEWFGLGGQGDPEIITVRPGEPGSDDPPDAP